MSDITTNAVIIGVDTHKATHVAVAIDTKGSRLAAFSAPATTKGYIALEDWACAIGAITAFGIEGTGSYGAGLSRHLLAKGHKVVEVTRPNRQLRYQHGKTDSLDAEGAARSVLAGQAIAEPKTHSGSVEMIRHLKIARDTAVKSRSQAMVTLKTLIINAPASLRDGLDQISGKIALIRHIAAFRPGALTSTTASAKTAMRALAQRWLALHDEIQAHDKALEQLASTVWSPRHGSPTSSRVSAIIPSTGSTNCCHGTGRRQTGSRIWSRPLEQRLRRTHDDHAG
jgi:transposase